MENFWIALNAVLPLSTYIVIGIAARKLRFADEAFFGKMNSFVFKLLFPFMMFSSINKADFAQTMNPALAMYVIVMTLLVVGLLIAFIPKVVPDNPTRASIVQACFRGNIAVFGLPLAISALGPENAAPVSVVVAITVVLYNIITILELEYYRGNGKTGNSIDWKKTLISIIKNPLIIGVYTGLAFNLSGLKMPVTMQKIVTDLATTASVASLIILGGSLKFSSFSQNRKYLFWGTLYKLIIQPAIMIPIAVCFGFRGPELFAIMVTFGAPVAVASYVMAYNMGANHELSGQYIATTTLGSVLTIFGWIYILLSLGLV